MLNPVRKVCLICSLIALALSYHHLASAQTESTKVGTDELVQKIINFEPPPVQCTSDDQRIPVLLLGSYHMANPGADMYNLEADDVLSPKRQEEIRTLVNRLAEFEPTKIAVEAPPGDSATVAHYAEYVESKRPLKRSELEQIGFRLAKQLGHERIYPIDVEITLDFDAVKQMAANDPEHQKMLTQLHSFGPAVIEVMARWLERGTVTEMLCQMNQPEFLYLAHETYMKFFLPIVDGDNYAGADLVADWYKRNIRIFANLHQITDSENDRVLVVYGQGHIPILRDLVEDSPYFCVVDALVYLQEEE